MKAIYSMVDGNVAEANRGNTNDKVERVLTNVVIGNCLCFQATAHAEKLFRLIDIDGDGKLTKNEFLRVSVSTVSKTISQKGFSFTAMSLTKVNLKNIFRNNLLKEVFQQRINLASL